MIAAIVAATTEGVIGLGGDLPWKLSSDLRRFKQLTMGCPIVMGRKTYDSIGRPLPGRETIVLTRKADWSAAGVRTASLPEALEICRHSERAFVIGGAEVYRVMLPHCDTLYLTRVWSQVRGDTHLELDLNEFQPLLHQRMPQTLRDSVPMEFLILTRRAAPPKK